MTTDPCPPLLREALAGASVAELARVLGTSESTIHAWKRGENVIPHSKVKWLERWCDSTQDTRDALVYWTLQRPRGAA